MVSDNIGNATGINGGNVNPVKPKDTDKPIPTANGVKGRGNIRV